MRYERFATFNCQGLTPVSKKICMMKVKSNNNVITNIISAYAPTLETTLTNPETNRHFYKKLSSIIKTFKTRKAIIIGGDFPTNIIGKYVKSEIYVDSEKMIEFWVINNMKITNIYFKHKSIHLTTWQSQCPYFIITDCKTNTPRRNLFRNQIDYVW